MKRAIKTLGLFALLSTSWLLAQEPDQPPMPQKNSEPIVRETGDLVLNYRGLIQKIDDMRQHEEEVLRKLEDLARSYDDGLRKIEETQKKLEDQIDKFEDWHDQAVERMKTINEAWAKPQEIKGEVNKPSDRYKSSYPE